MSFLFFLRQENTDTCLKDSDKSFGEVHNSGPFPCQKDEKEAVI